MNKFFFFIRKITVAPIVAAILLIVLQIFRPEVFSGWYDFAYSLFFLGALPLLAYPLQRFIPYFKDRGRDGQRYLAMVFAVLGYILGIVTGLIAHAPVDLIIIFAEYLLCGIIIAVVDKGFHKKVSAHACGIIGPIAMFIYHKLYIAAIIGAIVAVFVYISSLKTKRHTPWQLVGGSVIPVIALFAILFVGGLL